MEWVALGVLAVTVIAVTALVATGRIDPALSEPTVTRPPLDLPEQPTSEDVDSLRLGTSAYGLTPEDVDAALDARRARLAQQERDLANRDGHVHPDP